jgi:hypothetical protein
VFQEERTTRIKTLNQECVWQCLRPLWLEQNGQGGEKQEMMESDETGPGLPACISWLFVTIANAWFI